MLSGIRRANGWRCSLVMGMVLAGAGWVRGDIFVPNKVAVPAALEGFGASGISTVDPDAEYGAVVEVETSVPATGAGMDVNGFLGADRFYDAGITGQNASVASIEGGHIWSGHETLGQVTTFVTGTGALNDFDRHATWVGMLIGGRPTSGGNALQTGMAYGAGLRSGAIATSWPLPPYNATFNVTSNSLFSVYQSQFGSADVINSSWGFSDAIGANFFTTGLDGLARSNPLTTFVVSAGNGSAGGNSVAAPGSGYNNIAVASLGPGNGYDGVSSFSGRGPEDYYDPVHGIIHGVRAPVAIAAPGEALTSAFYGGATGGNTGGAVTAGDDLYSPSLAGTSFAAPLVAGAATLLDSAAKTLARMTDAARDARVIKAVLLNSADKTPGWNNGQAVVEGVIQTTQSLDYTVGAGRLDVGRAYDQFLSGTTDVPGVFGGEVGTEGWDLGVVAPLTQNTYEITTALQGGTTLTATLAWFRDRTFVNTSLTVDNAFRDLDLQVWDGSLTTLIAQSISNYNDVEHLSFRVPATGMYALRVVYDQTIFGPAAPETYGLAWDGAAVPEPSIGLLMVGVGIFRLRRRGARLLQSA